MKWHIDNIRTGLYQLFLTIFGITIGNFHCQNKSKDRLDLFLNDFFIILLILNHRQFLLRWLRKVVSKF